MRLAVSQAARWGVSALTEYRFSFLDHPLPPAISDVHLPSSVLSTGCKVKTAEGRTNLCGTLSYSVSLSLEWYIVSLEIIFLAWERECDSGTLSNILKEKVMRAEPEKDGSFRLLDRSTVIPLVIISGALTDVWVLDCKLSLKQKGKLQIQSSFEIHMTLI